MDFARLTLSPETFGWIASSMTLLTFMCADMRRLRFAALGANAAFIAYGALAQLWPVLVLHLLLVPVNLWRLAHAYRAEPQPVVAPPRSRQTRRSARGSAVSEAVPARAPAASPLH
jgi:hypothetical protein